MSTLIEAPYPKIKVTMILPNPRFDDFRAPQSDIIVKRSMLGRVITYVKSSTKEQLRLPFHVTRMKSLEIEEFFRVYYPAPLKITLYPNESNEAVYVGSLASPITRTAVGRHSSTEELISVTLDFIGEKQ